MHIVAFAGSTSRNSINKKFVTHALGCFTGHQQTLLDLNDFPLPLFSVDVEKEQPKPEAAAKFLEQMKQADLIIASLAEHNGSYSVAFKNLLDWCSRQQLKVFADKPMLLLSTSPGAMGGRFVSEAARNRFPRHGAQILASFSLPDFEKNFLVEKGITDPLLARNFQETIATVKKHFA